MPVKKNPFPKNLYFSNSFLINKYNHFLVTLLQKFLLKLD